MPRKKPSSAKGSFITLATDDNHPPYTSEFVEHDNPRVARLVAKIQALEAEVLAAGFRFAEFEHFPTGMRIREVTGHLTMCEFTDDPVGLKKK